MVLGCSSSSPAPPSPVGVPLAQINRAALTEQRAGYQFVVTTAPFWLRLDNFLTVERAIAGPSAPRQLRLVAGSLVPGLPAVPPALLRLHWPPGLRSQVTAWVAAAAPVLSDLARLPTRPGDVAAWRIQLEHDVDLLRAEDSGLRARVRSNGSPSGVTRTMLAPWRH